MNVARDPKAFFSKRHDMYARFIAAFRYKSGLRSFFLHSGLPRPGLRILDAGCGTGAVTAALVEALDRLGLQADRINAFDLTPAMLDHMGKVPGLEDVEVQQADVLALALPDEWTRYDLIVSSAMLEYIPKGRLVEALAALRQLMAENATFVLFMSKRNIFMRPLIGRLWASNLYTRPELQSAFRGANFSSIRFRHFPLSAVHLELWGHIVEAKR